MIPEPFIDSSTFITAKELPESNSAKIIELLAEKKFSAFVSGKVVREVFLFFKRHYGKQLASDYRYFILQSCLVVEERQLKKELSKWRGKIKAKDLEQLAAAKALKLRHLLAFDRDFEPFPEYITPKRFIALLGMKPAETDY